MQATKTHCFDAAMPGESQSAAMEGAIPWPELSLGRLELLGQLAQALLDVPLAWIIETPASQPTQAARQARGHEVLSRVLAEAAGIQFSLSCPLADADGHSLGLLILADIRKRHLSARMRERVAMLARTLASELALCRHCVTDPLTGLLNRSGLLQAGGNAMALCRRLNKPMSLVFVDLNGFKLINDRHGHQEGDEALRAFAQLMRRSFRSSDLVARLGGDEFVGLAVDDQCEGASSVRRLTRLVREYNRRSGKPYALAFSVGSVPWVKQAGLSLEQLMAQADERMYACKRQAQAERSREAGALPPGLAVSAL